MDLNSKEAIGWARVRGCPVEVKQAAVANVMGTFVKNRPYVNLLDPADMGATVINGLLYDGWTLTPPEVSDERTDDQRAGRESDSRSPG